MREYPPDRPRLEEIAGYLAGQLAQRPTSPVITTYLSTQLQRIRAAMEAADTEAHGPQRWRLTTLPTAVGQPKRGWICEADCFAAGSMPLTRERAIQLLDDPGNAIEICEVCRPEAGLRGRP